MKILISLFIVLLLPSLSLAETPPAKRVEFNRDILPILSDTCFHCHGPDAGQRQAELRLDTRTGLFSHQSKNRLIAPGQPEASELYRRIISADADERMPPEDSNRSLSNEQRKLIHDWIKQGAEWKGHWAFLPPVRPEIPDLKQSGKQQERISSPIDAFVIDRLNREQLSLAPPADKSTLLRRVTLDLTGLPPTVEERQNFLEDSSPDAYEKVVTRLLASPRYGERLAARWLDAARYADTNGYQTDGDRTMWRWRDWVINAYNANMPFDQFTKEQLAGDLLPSPTLDQQIATAFNRNHRGNGEGGVIAEEFAVEYVVDRVETTTTVWMGLTLGCARCHDHKYDPFSQKEFYQLYAFFNNIPESGHAVKNGNSPPMLKTPTRAQQAELRILDEKLQQRKARHEKNKGKLPSLLKLVQLQKAEDIFQDAEKWEFTEGQTQHFSLNESEKQVAQQTNLEEKEAAKTSLTFENGAAQYSVGYNGENNAALVLDGKRFASADVGKFGYFEKFSLSAWVNPQAENGIILSRMKDVEENEGYHLRLHQGKLQVNLVKRWLDDSVRVETREKLPLNQWQNLLVTYDGSRVAAGITVYINGKEVPLTVKFDGLYQTFESDSPFRIGSGGTDENRFHGKIDDVRIFNRVLTSEEAGWVAVPETVRELLEKPVAKLTSLQLSKRDAWLMFAQSPRDVESNFRQLRELKRERLALIDSFPTTMVMQEQKKIQPTHLLIRGEYNKPGEPVSRGIPSTLGGWNRDYEKNRLGFARWLTNAQHPLTARVAVNQHWEMFFGNGLVKTLEDFGTQGIRPTHPELLDWLATEFVRTGWDIKNLHRLIVTSATYRQSSTATAALFERDPENQLLARGPRLRLSAEMIRDQALQYSGQLVEQLGGPSVKPWQPAGLWYEVSGTNYEPDEGNAGYRRGLYTFWKRTVAPPMMSVFDASGRELCTVREARTNTPLQALTLLNDQTFVQAARKLTERMMTEGGTTPLEQITYGFRLVTSREPSERELKILLDGWERNQTYYQQHPQEATRFTKGTRHHRPTFAAYNVTASLLLNLDEVITRY